MSDTESLPAESPARGPRLAPDLLLLLLAILFALPTLTYPFGRDQAAHAYIGWGWLRGFIPFRDAMDQKPPGIYLLYALSGALFGRRQLGIRVVDLVGVLLTGWLATSVVHRRAVRQAGEVGAVILMTSGFYFTCFDYWNSAQAELWQGLALLAGALLLLRQEHPLRAAVVSGALGGVAVLFKLTAGVVCLGLAALVVARAWSRGGSLGARLRRSLGWAALQLLGGAAVLTLTGAYFATRGALGPALDVLVRFNLAYGTSWRADAATAAAWTTDFWIRNSGVWTAMILGLWLVAVTGAVRRRERPVVLGALGVAALLALGVLAVAVQGKYFSYHWGLLIPFLAAAAAYGIAEQGRRHPRLVPWLAVSLTALGLALAPEWICNRAAEAPRPTTYLRMSGSAWSYLLGRTPRSTFLEPFDGGYSYNYADEELVGQLIRRLARPGDSLRVVGFEPAVLVVSGLRCPSRFFIETLLRERRVTLSRKAWIREVEETYARHPPRFVVVTRGEAAQLPAFEQEGYHRLAEQGQLVLLERS
jgi:hypothetical protein